MSGYQRTMLWFVLPLAAFAAGAKIDCNLIAPITDDDEDCISLCDVDDEDCISLCEDD